jgi:hypothetical protein
MLASPKRAVTTTNKKYMVAGVVREIMLLGEYLREIRIRWLEILNNYTVSRYFNIL